MTNINDSAVSNVRDAIRRLRDLPGDLEAEDDPAFTTEQVNFLEKRLYEVRAVLERGLPNDESVDFDLRVQERLARQRKIAVIWSIEDVQQGRPDLTDDQAWEVLEQVEDIHDAEWGINWTTLETVADDMFPKPTSRRRKP